MLPYFVLGSEIKDNYNIGGRRAYLHNAVFVVNAENDCSCEERIEIDVEARVIRGFCKAGRFKEQIRKLKEELL